MDDNVKSNNSKLKNNVTEQRLSYVISPNTTLLNIVSFPHHIKFPTTIVYRGWLYLYTINYCKLF